MTWSDIGPSRSFSIGVDGASIPARKPIAGMLAIFPPMFSFVRVLTSAF